MNLITLLLTGFSWVILGIFYGWGYCFLTDWHWQVLRKTGELNLPDAYVPYFLNRVMGIHISALTADYLTVILFIIALLVSIYVNLKYRIKA